jgi:hypothetical protein
MSSDEWGFYIAPPGTAIEDADAWQKLDNASLVEEIDGEDDGDVLSLDTTIEATMNIPMRGLSQILAMFSHELIYTVHPTQPWRGLTEVGYY